LITAFIDYRNNNSNRKKKRKGRAAIIDPETERCERKLKSGRENWGTTFPSPEQFSFYITTVKAHFYSIIKVRSVLTRNL
jgi:hypothetical protein